MTQRRETCRKMEKLGSFGPTVYVLPLNPEQLAAAEGWQGRLPQQRREELARLQNPKARRLSLAAEVLLRQAVAANFCRDAFALERGREEGGKPFFPKLPQVCFNVSHTQGLAACVLAGSPVGVDVECLLRPAPLEIMRRTMTHGEQQLVLQAPSAGRTRAFYQIWTRKEAFLKWSGRGLGGGLILAETTEPPLLEQLQTRVWQDWVLSVCGAPGLAFCWEQVSFQALAAGRWETTALPPA